MSTMKDANRITPREGEKTLTDAVNKGSDPRNAGQFQQIKRDELGRPIPAPTSIQMNSMPAPAVNGIAITTAHDLLTEELRTARAELHRLEGPYQAAKGRVERLEQAVRGLDGLYQHPPALEGLERPYRGPVGASQEGPEEV